MTEHRVPSIFFFGILLAWIGVVILLSFTWGVQPAMYTFAGSLIGLALARLILPAGMVPQVRSRWFDVLTLLGLAMVLGYFANWGDTLAVV
ncbi:DUF3017 domain-containing protein [Arcanobacterium pinnipediorum]|uniref:DUF3017 domain-containing protein n=1 Tax=Arcanobacterium pinnipediorum TaxID=1503041 RepID=A0ABY5AG84_9ACTO|nr:DUF3017 domain-containing protein [Arcanobacterium pinnipediorum]USR78996.1 DUF3017 domain-containing protein [Arcanobacterium pinnipediorum]